MKRILLAACTLAAAFSINAQTPGVDKVNGIVFDDFAQTTEYGDSSGGIFWWGDSILGSGENPNFKATLTRDTANTELDVVLTQGYGEYVPFGLGLGDTKGDGTGDLVQVDMSANPVYIVTFTNNSDSTLDFRVSPQDINNNVIDTDSAWTGLEENTAYKYTIDVRVGPNSSATLQAGGASTGGETLSGTFTGASQADYDCAVGAPCKVTDLDLTKITGFNITVTNAIKNEADGFKPYALDAINISVNSFQVGAEPTGISDELAESGVSIYPNPAVSSLNISEELENVSVFNSQGIQVLAVEKASKLDVSSLETGVYVLKSNKGTTTFVIK